MFRTIPRSPEKTEFLNSWFELRFALNHPSDWDVTNKSTTKYDIYWRFLLFRCLIPFLWKGHTSASCNAFCSWFHSSKGVLSWFISIINLQTLMAQQSQSPIRICLLRLINFSAMSKIKGLVIYTATTWLKLTMKLWCLDYRAVTGHSANNCCNYHQLRMVVHVVSDTWRV